MCYKLLFKLVLFLSQSVFLGVLPSRSAFSVSKLNTISLWSEREGSNQTVILYFVKFIDFGLSEDIIPGNSWAVEVRW